MVAHLVEEPAVVGHHGHGRRARRAGQEPGEPGDRLDVQVVGRLVEQQHVTRVDQRPGQGQPASLAAGQALEPGVQPLRVALRPDAAEQAGRAPRGSADPPPTRAPGGCPTVTSRTVRAPGGRASDCPTMTTRASGRADDPPGVGLGHAGEHPEQRRLAVAVAPDDPDPLAPLDAQGDPGEDRTRREHDVDVLEGDDGRHGAQG